MNLKEIQKKGKPSLKDKLTSNSKPQKESINEKIVKIVKKALKK